MSGAEEQGNPEGGATPVAAYKEFLRGLLDRRPSGTRQKLATTLGKNRSFVSQIANPSYPVPIPARHLETLFEVCRFSQEERRAFLALYEQAHPGRTARLRPGARTRMLQLHVPDLRDARKNRAVDLLVGNFVRSLVRTIDEIG